jgi:hypothetical protein
MNPIEIIRIIPKHAQALQSDGVLYFSGEESIATSSRKSILLHDINFIKEHLDILEKALV